MPEDLTSEDRTELFHCNIPDLICSWNARRTTRGIPS